jgi:hypothetical protein
MIDTRGKKKIDNCFGISSLLRLSDPTTSYHIMEFLILKRDGMEQFHPDYQDPLPQLAQDMPR